MNYRKIEEAITREVNSELKKKNQKFVSPSEMIVTCTEDPETKEVISAVTVTHVGDCISNGIGFPVSTMFETMKRLGFHMPKCGKRNLEVDGYVYTFFSSIENAAQIT